METKTEDIPKEWKTDDSYVTAAHNIQNNKDVKYARKLLSEYGKREDTQKQNYGLKSEDFECSRFSTKHLKKLFKLMKATKADNVELKVADNYPIVATFLKNGESQGSFMIAPKIDTL